MYRCGVCGISATSVRRSVFARLANIELKGRVSRHLQQVLCPVEGDLQQHLRGRVHREGLERQKALEKSIYLRGFPNTVNLKQLQSFLENQVGKVESVWMNEGSSVSSYALVEFVDASDALKALHMPQISLEGKRLVVKPRTHHSTKTSHTTTSNTATSHPSTSNTTTNTTTNTITFGQRRKQTKKSSGGSPPPKKGSQDKKSISDQELKEVLKFSTLDGQLKHLSDLNKLPLLAVQDQLVVTFDVLREIRKSFPHCMVIPFGSVISSFATLHSDCDLCLLTRPPPYLATLFTGANYFSRELLSMVEKLEVEYNLSFSPPSPIPSPSPPGAIVMSSGDEENDDADISIVSSSSSSASLSSFRFSSRVRSASKDFRTLCQHLITVSAGHSFRPIPHARCPIVCFVHRNTSLQCDICIDSILGPLNTRLIKSYCDFDPRLSILMPVVKMWAHQKGGIPRQHLNSYALSLMAIYALQHSSPPALPCLQQPDHWPRDMTRTMEMGTVVENEVGLELTGFWKTKFTSSFSLQPSLNSNTTVEILHHFFKFYDEEFDFSKDVVSIRSPHLLTRREAKELAKSEGDPRRKKKPLDAFTSLVVQDPFDLDHNVTKILNMLELKRLRNNFKEANQVLQKELEKTAEPVSILALFDETTPTGSTHLSTSIALSRLDLAHLLSDASYLIGHLEELDLESSDVRYCLGQVVLKEVRRSLSLKFGFVVEADPIDDVMEEAKSPGHMTSSPGHMTSQADAVVDEGPSSYRKRRRRSSSEDMLPKRAREDDDTSAGPHALDVLYGMLPPKPHPYSYTCTAFENTWVHARRARRKHLQEESGGKEGESPSDPPESSSAEDLSAMLDTLPTPLPRLQLQLELLPPPQTSKEGEMCTLKMKRIQGKDLDFHTFIAVIKKMLVSGKK